MFNNNMKHCMLNQWFVYNADGTIMQRNYHCINNQQNKQYKLQHYWSCKN